MVRGMRSAVEYLERAAEFDRLAKSSNDPDLQTQLAAVAESFRLIARERQRLIKAGLIEPETP
jgi:hypothetical protein